MPPVADFKRDSLDQFRPDVAPFDGQLCQGAGTIDASDGVRRP